MDLKFQIGQNELQELLSTIVMLSAAADTGIRTVFAMLK